MSLKLPVIRDHHAVHILGRLVHHWVRPPGGLADKQSSALFFWFVECFHKVSALFLFTHATAVFRRFTNSSLDSNFVGMVSMMRSFRRPHAFSIALKSCDAIGYGSRSLSGVLLNEYTARGHLRHDPSLRAQGCSYPPPE